MVETFSLDLGGGAEIRFRVLRGWFERLRGLLGSDERAAPVVLVGCSSVHTFGMAYAIDVALVDREGRVCKARRALPPRRVMAARRGWLAFERPASAGPWMSEGGSMAPCLGMCRTLGRGRG